MFRPATIATGGARFRLRASAADLAHALISGATDFRPQVRAQILDALQRQGAAGRKGADYVTALHWAQAVSDGRRPPDPIIFRSLGRSVDWLAALEFFAAAQLACDGLTERVRRSTPGLQKQPAELAQPSGSTAAPPVERGPACLRDTASGHQRRV